DVLVDRRRERVMDGGVAIRVRVALEEREVDDPEKAVLALRHPSEPLAELEADARQDGRRQRLRLGEQEEQMAGLETSRRREAFALGLREELRRRRLPAVRTDPDPREPARALGGREADQVVELATRQRRAAAGNGEPAHGVARRQRFGEDAESRPGKACREVAELEVDAEVGPIG